MNNGERFKLYAATYLILIKNEKILLLKRFNTGWQDGNYSLISGHLDGNETVTESMAREAKEESGIIIKPENLKVIHTMHRISKDREYIDFFLTAIKWQGDPKVLEPEKCSELTWYPLEQLPENIIPHVKKAIENQLNNIAYSEE